MAARKNASWMLSFVMLSIFTSTRVSALDCVVCEDFSASASTGIPGTNPFSGRSNPGCATQSWGTKTCSYDEYCGAVKAKVTVSLPLVGSYSGEMIVRSCMADPGVGLGCQGNDQLEGLLGDVLTFLAKLGAVTVKGRLCLSDGTSVCPRNSLFIYPWLTKDFVCVHWGYIGGGIAAVVLLLVGMCACCYCCCCRSKRPLRSVVLTTTSPQVLTVHTTSPGRSNQPYLRLEEAADPQDIKY